MRHTKILHVTSKAGPTEEGLFHEGGLSKDRKICMHGQLHMD